jgi:hypothetical protein
VEQTEVERLIGELEIAVDRLRSLYEQYFMGIEKIEPMVARKDVDRRIYVLRKEQIRNTALRFRFQMLLQRYNTYQTHWQRICRDIENGTYKRHILRAQRRFGVGRAAGRSPSAPPPAADRSLAAELAELDRDFAPPELLDDRDVQLDEEPALPRRPLPSKRPPATARSLSPPTPRTPLPPRAHVPGKTPIPPRTRTPPPPSRPALSSKPPRPPPRSPSRPGAAGDLPDSRVRQLYEQYVEAKRRQNESTAAITYDALARSLRESSEKLRQKLGRTVDFEVVVKDGRAVLRPVVK